LLARQGEISQVSIELSCALGSPTAITHDLSVLRVISSV
jgi:hypothetical protein